MKLWWTQIRELQDRIEQLEREQKYRKQDEERKNCTHQTIRKEWYCQNTQVTMPLGFYTSTNPPMPVFGQQQQQAAATWTWTCADCHHYMTKAELAKWAELKLETKDHA